MTVKIDLLNRWLEKLGGYNNILGLYEQGSAVWGFADENSDRDFIIVWKDNYPDKNKRQKALEELGGTVHQFQDIPEVEKGVDMFELGTERLNVAHVKSNDFFDYYNGLNNLGEYYFEQLLRIGGFVNGNIYYDYEGKLEKYRQSIKLTDDLVKLVKIKLKNDLEFDLKLLEIAAKRKSTLRFISQLSVVLDQLHIWYYMKKKMWLMSDKWFEKFTNKYGWDDEFTSLLKDIKKGLDIEIIANRLLEIAKSWGFEPSKKFKS